MGFEAVVARKPESPRRKSLSGDSLSAALDELTSPVMLRPAGSPEVQVAKEA